MSSKNPPQKTLDSFCQTRSSFKTKIALFTFYKLHYPKWFDQIVLILEYLQLMSQVLLLPGASYDQPAHDDLFFQIVVYFFKLINPSYLLTYQQPNSLTLTVLIMILCLVFLKILLFAYVICVSLWDWKPYDWLIYLWRWVFKLQTRGIYFLVTSFWIRALIFSLDDQLRAIEMNQGVTIFFTILVVLIELTLSLIIQTQFCYVLPEKNFLSSKNNDLAIITLLQKFTMQLLLLTLRSNSKTNAWMISIILLIFSLYRNHLCYRYLPLYHFKALTLQGDLTSIMLTLNIVYCVNTILRTANDSAAGINFIIISSIWISLLAIRISREILNNKIMKLLCTKTSREDPEILLHKIVSAKEIGKYEQLPGKRNGKFHFTYLLSVNKNIKFADVFGFQPASDNLSKEEMNKIFILYCEDLLLKYPQSTFLKVYLAKLYSKNFESFTKTIKLASEVESQKWSKYYLTASLLLSQVEKSILDIQQKTESPSLDFMVFLKSKVLIEDLKKEIIKQTDLYLRVYENILGDISDFGEIYNSAQLINKSKKIIHKTIDQLPQILPETFTSPYLLSAEYHLVLNYSLIRFNKYISTYAHKYFKSERYFKDPDLNAENLYQDSNAFLLISSQKQNAGEILFANKSLQNLCGTGSTGKHVSTLFSPGLRAHYTDLFRNAHTCTDLMNKIQHGFLYHRSKYLIEADFCLKYHPYLNQNLCFDMIIRSVPRQKRFILIRENGDIEGASKEISKIFGLNTSSSNVNIKHLSEELSLVNVAFNMVHRNCTTESVLQTPDPTTALKKFFSSSHGHNDSSTNYYHQCFTFETSRTKMSFQNALDLHSAYAKEDQKVYIYPIQGNGESVHKKSPKRKGYKFYCNVQIVPSPSSSMLLKLITFKDPSSTQGGLQSHIFEETDHDYLTSPNFKTNEFTPTPNKKDTPQQRFFFRDEDMASENIISYERDQYDTENIRPFFEEKLQTVLPNNDFPLLTSPVSETRRFFLETQGTTTRRLDTLPVPGESKLSPLPRKRRTSLAVDVAEIQQPSMMLKLTDEVESVQLNNMLRKKEKIEKYLSSHGSSQRSSTEKASNKAFRAAILEKTYPRSFNVLCVIFYGVILFTFVSQIVMKISSDWTMTDLQLKKDLLKDSEERSYKAMLAQINAIGGALQVQGALLIGGAIGGLDVSIGNLKSRTADMKTANSNMLKNTYALEDDIKKEFFQKDVRMYGTFLDSLTSESDSMTSFQATENLLNAAKAIADLQNPVSTEGLNGFYYIANNVLNDFEYKNLQITQTLINSVEKQKKSYQNTTFLCVILTPFLLIGIAILLTVIILNQYRIEKRQMCALIKLKSPTMKDLQDRIKKFQRSLIHEENLQDNLLPNMSEDFNMFSSLQNDVIASTYSKRNDTQVIKYKRFRQRYYKYILCVVLYISVLVSINIWDWVSTTKATDVIYKRQEQLQFANYISNRVTVGYASFAVLFISNDTMPVEHKEPFQAMSDGAIEAKKIQNQVLNIFQEVDGNYNPAVKDIIFKDNPSCDGFVADNQAKCKLLVNTGQPVNMIAALSVFQGLLTNKKQDFLNADKTSLATLLTAAYINIQSLLPNFVIIASEAQMIGNIIDETLTRKIEQTRKDRLAVVVVFSVCLLVVSILAWFHILKRIRGVFNHFKKVLQILPPGLVLSSYLLKKFLNQTTSQPISL